MRGENKDPRKEGFKKKNCSGGEYWKTPGNSSVGKGGGGEERVRNQGGLPHTPRKKE